MGTVVISLDAELAWGFHDFQQLPQHRIKNARSSWSHLVNLFEEFDIPATWAIVGHLFLEECDGEHSEHPSTINWFNNDPGQTIQENPNWFGPDLVKEVVESDVDHDIGSHSFSHVEFGRSDTTEDTAKAEISTCVELAQKQDINPESFVFPRNNIGKKDLPSWIGDLLRENGFVCYRGSQPDSKGLKNLTRRLVRLSGGRTGPPIVEPSIDSNGLVNIPASLYLFSFEGEQDTLVKKVGQAVSQTVFSVVSHDPIPRQVKLGLEKVKQTDDGILHLWMHPNNITGQSDFTRMKAVLKTINDYRDEENVDVKTMRGIAKNVKNKNK